MATLPDLPAQAFGQPARASFVNGNLEYAINFALRPRMARVYRTAGLTFTSGGYGTPQWDTTSYDTDGMHTSANILTVQTAGYYFVESLIILGGGSLTVQLRKNAAGSVASGTQITGFVGGTGDTYVMVSSTDAYNQGDTVECFAIQSSGSNQSLVGGTAGSYMQARCVGLL